MNSSPRNVERESRCPHHHVKVFIADERFLTVRHYSSSTRQVSMFVLDFGVDIVSTMYDPVRMLTEEEWNDYDTCPVLPRMMVEAVMTVREVSMLEAVLDIFFTSGGWIHHYRGW